MRHINHGLQMSLSVLSPRIPRTACGLLGMLLLGACSGSNLLSNPGRLIPDTSTFANVRATPEKTLTPITPADLVNADGQCAGGGETAAATASAEGGGGLPPALPGVALEMTECEVVRRTGQPQEVQIGANERGDRTAVVVYRSGVRPGIYRFRAGRLVTIEAVAQSGPEPKKKPAKKPRRAAG